MTFKELTAGNPATPTPAEIQAFIDNTAAAGESLDAAASSMRMWSEAAHSVFKSISAGRAVDPFEMTCLKIVMENPPDFTSKEASEAHRAMCRTKTAAAVVIEYLDAHALTSVAARVIGQTICMPAGHLIRDLDKSLFDVTTDGVISRKTASEPAELREALDRGRDMAIINTMKEVAASMGERVYQAVKAAGPSGISVETVIKDLGIRDNDLELIVYRDDRIGYHKPTSSDSVILTAIK